MGYYKKQYESSNDKFKRDYDKQEEDLKHDKDEKKFESQIKKKQRPGPLDEVNGVNG